MTKRTPEEAALDEIVRERREEFGLPPEIEPHLAGADDIDFLSMVPKSIALPPPGPCKSCGSITDWGETCRRCFQLEEEAIRAKAYREAPLVWLNRSVPSRYEGATFEDPDTLRTRCHGNVQAMAAVSGNKSEPWVAFVGPSGSGKTTLAVAGLRLRVSWLHEFWRVMPAFRLSQARIQHSAGKGEAPLVAKALRSPFVLLDDIGSEAQTANNPIGEIIQERDAEDRPTWITTGLSREDLGNRYGGGVARRILERSKVVRLGAVREGVAR